MKEKATLSNKIGQNLNLQTHCRFQTPLLQVMTWELSQTQRQVCQRLVSQAPDMQNRYFKLQEIFNKVTVQDWINITMFKTTQLPKDMQWCHHMNHSIRQTSLERESSYTWTIPHDACDNTTNWFPFNPDCINGSNHLLCVFRIRAADNIAFNLAMLHI